MKTTKLQNLLKLAISAALLCSASAYTFAEIIAMPGDGRTYQVSSNNAAKPSKAITKDDVLKQFGEPLSKRGPVGSPAIYQWEYPEYTVYFENNRVIHSVSK